MVLAIIPARGGSKGIPRKNIHPVAGKPLIAWTIEAARSSRYIDRLILSSDDPEIIAMARSYGCEVPFVRPSELAQDDTPGISPVLHALAALPEIYDFVVLLQPTSPLRMAEDIDACIDRCTELSAPACVTVNEVSQHPMWMFHLDEGHHLQPLFADVPARRQDLPPVYAINGAVYVAAVPDLCRSTSFIGPATVAHVMPVARSLDIDTPDDLAQAETYLTHSEKSP